MIFTNIHMNVYVMEGTPNGSTAKRLIMSRLSSEWTAYFLFKAVYLIAVLVFSLLSTSAVVYTVACVYTSKDVSFGKILTVVPKVWKRLMVTFLWSFAILFVYNLSFLLLIIAILLVVDISLTVVLLTALLTLTYLSGMVYISIVWHLASVVSVVEDSYGIAAMRKSKSLIRGKEWTVATIFIVVQFHLAGVELAFGNRVVRGGDMDVGVRLGFGAVITVMLTLVVLVALVVQTVVYFVCKSYHHESIDKSSLANHLEVYLEEYTPLTDKDVQLQQIHVISSGQV